MGFLDRAIKRGISNAVGRAVETSVRNVVAPKVEEVTANAVNSAANSINNAVGANQAPAQPQGSYQQGGYQQGGYQQFQPASQVNQAEVSQAASTLGGIFGAFGGAAMNFANEAAKNMKICPACGEGASADNTFCPSCGAKLPETTVAQDAVCTACGAQNSVGTKFCAKCGAKLPAALAEERAAEARNAEVMAQWDECLANYPKWDQGGTDFEIEQSGVDEHGRPIYYFNARNTNFEALRRYKETLKANGFMRPPTYSTDDCLYKVVNGVSYSFNAGDPFCSDPGYMTVYFEIREFEQPKPKDEFELPKSLKGLFKF